MSTFYSILLNSPAKNALSKWLQIYEENENKALIELMQLFIDFLASKKYLNLPENCIGSDILLKNYFKTLRRDITIRKISEKKLKKLKTFLNCLCEKAHNNGFLYKNNLFLKLTNFLKEFSLIPQSEKIVSYAATYFLLALASFYEIKLKTIRNISNNQSATDLLTVDRVDSSNSSSDDDICLSILQRRSRIRDRHNQVNKRMIEQEIDYLNRMFTNLFSILKNAIHYLINDKNLTNDLFHMLSLNLQFLNIKTCQQFYVTILTTGQYQILTIVLNHIHSILSKIKNVRDDDIAMDENELYFGKEMLEICSLDDMKEIFFYLLMDKRISIQKTILLILIEIHDHFGVFDRYLTDAKQYDFIFMKLYDDNSIIIKLTLKLIFRKCKNTRNFLEYIINHFVQFQNNVDKVNLIIESGWKYKEFQNFRKLYELLKKYIGITSVKTSIVIIKIIVHSSNIMFHKCTSSQPIVADINLFKNFLKLLPQMWKTVGDNNNEVIIEIFLNVFNVDIYLFYRNLLTDYDKLMSILNELFFKQSNYITIKYLYQIFINFKLSNSLTHTIFGDYLMTIQCEPETNEMENLNRLSIYTRFCVMVEHDNYSISVTETKDVLNILNILKRQMNESGNNENDGILIITYSNLLVYFFRESLRQTGDILLEIQEDFHLFYQQLKGLLKLYDCEPFFAYAVYTSFCRITYSLKRQIKDTAFTHLCEDLSTDTFEDVINFLDIYLSIVFDNDIKNIYFARSMIISLSKLYSFNVAIRCRLVWKMFMLYANATHYNNEMEKLLKSICSYSCMNYRNQGNIFCESIAYILVKFTSIKILNSFLQKLSKFFNNNFTNDQHKIIGNIYACILNNEFLSTSSSPTTTTTTNANNTVKQHTDDEIIKILNIFIKLCNFGEDYLDNFPLYIFQLCQNYKLKLSNQGKTVIDTFCENIRNIIVTLDSDDDDDNIGVITETIDNDSDHIHDSVVDPTTVEISDTDTEKIPETLSNLSQHSSTIECKLKKPRIFSSSLSPILSLSPHYVLPALTTISEAHYSDSDASILY